jgi:hypothetical protein
MRARWRAETVQFLTAVGLTVSFELVSGAWHQCIGFAHRSGPQGARALVHGWPESPPTDEARTRKIRCRWPFCTAEAENLAHEGDRWVTTLTAHCLPQWRAL